MQETVGVAVHPYTRYGDFSFKDDLESVSSAVNEVWAVTVKGEQKGLIGEEYFDGFLDDFNGHGGLSSRELEQVEEYNTAYVFGYYFHDCVPGAAESLMRAGFDTVVLEDYSYIRENDEIYSLGQREELDDLESLLRNLYIVAPEITSRP